MENSSNNYCRICELIVNPFYGGELRPCDTPFYGTKSFLVIPALGPLSVGHAMIVSKKHSTSLLSMEKDIREEFEGVCSVLSEKWPHEQLIFAEHGSSSIDGSGPCIAHTHVNVIPGVPEEALKLDQLGHSLLASGSLGRMPTMSESYFLIGRENVWSLYQSGATTSQYLRQLLYRSFGLLHWDWRLLPNEAVAAETLEKWSSYLTL